MPQDSLMSLKRCLSALLLVLALPLCGCADNFALAQYRGLLVDEGFDQVAPAHVEPVNTEPTFERVQGPYLLDTGDHLRIFVYGQPSLSRGYTVEHDGYVSVPLIGRLRTRGRTPKQVEQAIMAALAEDFIRDPHVTVDILQNRPFFILGEVRTAGKYPYVSGMTVETAVAIAGGYSERASAETFRLTRTINGIMRTLEVPADFIVRPGDTVFVYERFF